MHTTSHKKPSKYDWTSNTKISVCLGWGCESEQAFLQANESCHKRSAAVLIFYMLIFYQDLWIHHT